MNSQERIKKIIKKYVPKRLVNLYRNGWGPEKYKAGHYYSAIPALKEVNKKAQHIFSKDVGIKEININLIGQLKLLEEFKKLSLHKSFIGLPFKRFNIENYSFSYDDAPILHYILRTIKPRKIIEIGCGNSSALMLDTNELYLNNHIHDFTFIDIDLTRIRSLLLDKDYERIELIERPLQEVELSIFNQLSNNDLLFIDSSHVSKIGSDLHTIMFDILPRLNAGVYVHFHDIRFPFEYQKERIFNKVFWNEAYLLRAFLMYNNTFEISFWLNYLLSKKVVDSNQLNFLPLTNWDERFNESRNDFSNAGGSIYIKKCK